MLLLNAVFMAAYEFGILVEFGDQIIRRVFPRLFAYMADYPEKYILYLDLHDDYTYQINRILMAGIRNMGLCPCPRCTIEKIYISKLGTPMDEKRRMKLRRNTHHFRTKVSIARDLIYKGHRIRSTPVGYFLKEESLVPTTVSPRVIFLNYI